MYIYIYYRRRRSRRAQGGGRTHIRALARCSDEDAACARYGTIPYDLVCCGMLLRCISTVGKSYSCICRAYPAFTRLRLLVTIPVPE